MKAFLLIVTAVALGMSVAVAEDKPQASATHNPTNIVARVGDRNITWGELDMTVTAMSKQFAAYGRKLTDEQLPLLRYDILQQMVTHELALQEARGHEATNINELVEKQIAAAKTQAGSEDAFTNALAAMNVTMPEFTQRLREDLIVRERLRQIAESTSKVTPEDVKKFYDDNQDKMKLPERVRASHILIAMAPTATEEEKKQKLTQIESVQTLLKQGEKFGEMAKKYSEDPVSARNNGDLGYFARGQMVGEFEQVAFSLKTNEVSGIVTTKFGYHILLITDHQAAGLRTFDEVKADIEKYLIQQKEQEVAADHVKKLRDTGKFEVFIPKPEPPASAAATPSVVTPAVKAPPRTVETKPVAAPKP